VRLRAPLDKYIDFAECKAQVAVVHGTESRLTLICTEGFAAGSLSSNWRICGVF
jgi:hypothetical protein